MFFEKLYDNILIEPILNGADELNIISGYATPSMATRHLEEVLDLNPKIKIKLIVGMTKSDGLPLSSHNGFINILESKKFGQNFACQYVCDNAPVHTKLFLWKKDNKFHSAFLGSANYSQTAFSLRQRELVEMTGDERLMEYYNTIEKDSINALHAEIEEYVKILSDKNYYKNITKEGSEKPNENPKKESLLSFKVPLYNLKTNEVQRQGGLNWGQRPGRNKNQAYIQLPPEVYNSDFFPKKPNHFILVTDDHKSLLCVRAQKAEKYGGTAIHTTLDNSRLGEYFRNRMNLPEGAPIWKKDLEAYGRTDVTFHKIDDETFLMDFSV